MPPSSNRRRSPKQGMIRMASSRPKNILAGRKVRSMNPDQIQELLNQKRSQSGRLLARILHRSEYARPIRNKLGITINRRARPEEMRRRMRKLEDVRQRTEAEYVKELKRRSERDPKITSLFNVSTFQRKAQAIFSSRKGGVIIFIDFDNFKAVNEVLSHEIADVPLIYTGNLLASQSKLNNGIAGRWGGEELVVALPGGMKDGIRFIRRVNQIKEREWDRQFENSSILRSLVRERNTRFNFSFSAGMASTEEGFEDYAAWERAAEQRTKYTKGNGKNGFTYRSRDGKTRYISF